MGPALLTLAAFLGVAGDGGPMGPFGVCEAEYAPGSRASAECFFRTARRERRWHEAALYLRRRLDRDPRNHWLRYYLGNVHWWDDRGRAIQWYEDAARGFSAQGEKRGELMARGNMRDLLMQEGRISEADLQMKLVAEAVAGATDGELLSRAYLIEAQHLWETSQDLGRAERLLGQARELLVPAGPYALQKNCLLYLGNVALELGDLEGSLEYNRELEGLARRAEDGLTLAAAQHNIANALRLELEEGPRATGRLEALARAREALETAERAGHREAEVMSHRLLGALLTPDEIQRPEARRHFERCLELARAYDLRQEGGNCRWEFARLLAKENPARARRTADEAVRVAQEHGDAAYIAFAWRQKMRAAWGRPDVASALAESIDALAAVEKLREQQLGERSRAGLFSKWTADYYFVSGSLIRAAGRFRAGEGLDTAFAVIERMRARTLLESSVFATGSRERGVRSESFDRFAGIEALRARLAPAQAILSFQLGLWHDLYGEFGGGAWALVVTQQGVRSVALPERTRLESAVEVLLGLVDRRDGSEQAFSERLYSLLARDALKALPSGIEELIVIPDDVLHRLPFGVLHDAGLKEPLSSRFALSVVPSATLWRRWREHRWPTLRPSALALADPGAASVTALTPVNERGWPWFSRERWGPLPYARQEGRSVVRRFGGDSVLLLQGDASEKRLKETDLSRHGVIHFAAHAVVDERHPDRSAILLAPGSHEEDGWLQVGEIAALDLDGQLIGLSACQTADGALLRGEGVLNLARAFFQAGARAVVASLWPLRDEEAAWLFDTFYARVVRGHTAAEALRDTQREAIRRGFPAAAWASLVLIGDGSTRPVPGGIGSGRTVERSLWMAGIVIALTIALLVVYTRRRS